MVSYELSSSHAFFLLNSIFATGQLYALCPVGYLFGNALLATYYLIMVISFWIINRGLL